MQTTDAESMSNSVSQHRPVVRVPLWCAIGSIILAGALEGYRFHDLRWFDFVWFGLSIFPYLLIVLFLSRKRTYLGLMVALPINLITILVVAWGVGIATGQGGRIKTSNVLPFLVLLALVSVQAVSILTSIGAVLKTPKSERYPPAWVVMPLTLVGLYGLSLLFGWIMSWEIKS